MKRARRIIAHRGASGLAPENTLNSIVRALQLGVDGVEVDVRALRDGVPIVFHDASLRRILRDDRMVCEVGLDEMKAMGRKLGLPIPTLREVLRVINGKAMLVIEVKEWRAVNGVVEELRGTTTAMNVVISSFDHRIPLHIKAEVDWVKAGFIVSLRPLSLSKLVDECVDVVFVRKDYVDEELVREALELGLDLYAWVINDPVEAEEFWRLGVTGVVTDRPDLVKVK
ncbi:MAG: hypothetical protein DRJ62_07350 [Thermoprotei archaeon]|nr:MAG: hypothetical protein DRJ62_07350 [Thermoprotei archaeon]